MNKQHVSLFLLAASLAVNVFFCGIYSVERHQHEMWKAQSEKEHATLIDFSARLTQESERAASLKQQLEEQAQKIADFQAVSMYEYVGVCTVTAYCTEKYPHICGTGDGITSSGLPVAPGMVAVDPDIIPLGSIVYIDGMPYLAADTGESIKGHRIDIAMETHEEAINYGVQQHEVWIVRIGGTTE